MRADTLKAVTVAGAVIVAGVVAWQLIRAGRGLLSGVGDAANTWNPANPNNPIARTVNGAVSNMTDGAALSVGDALYQLTEKIGELFGATPAGQVATAPSGYMRAPVIVPRAQMDATRDQEDADQGPGFAASWWTPADQDDADMGAALMERPFIDYSAAVRRYRRGR